MRFMKMKIHLFIVVVILALALSVLYGRKMEGFASSRSSTQNSEGFASRSSTQSSLGTEGFMDAGTGAAIGVGILGVVVIGAFFYGIKPERVF